MEADITDRHLSPAKFMPCRYSTWIIKSTDEDIFFAAVGLPGHGRFSCLFCTARQENITHSVSDGHINISGTNNPWSNTTNS